MAMILRVTVVALLSSGGAAMRMRRAARDVAPSPGNKVVVIGDSFASGTGIHIDGDDYDERWGGTVPGYQFTLTPEKGCWREKESTPGPMYAASQGMESTVLACKGAEIPHIHQQWRYLNDVVYPEDAAHSWNNSMILLTTGGNDLRSIGGDNWPSIIRGCLTWFNCHKNPDNVVANGKEVEDNMTELFSTLAREAPAATIRIMGYPKLMQRRSGGRCARVVFGLLYHESDWLDDLVETELEAVLWRAVARTKAAYPDVDLDFVSILHYLNKGACNYDNDRHVNAERFTRWPPGISEASFHPTQSGYNQYYKALVDNLEGHRQVAIGL